MITYEQALERVRPLVEANPEFIYTPEGGSGLSAAGACTYFHSDGKPGCLVGQAFPEELAAVGVDPDSGRNTEGIFVLIREGLFSATPKAAEFLTALQRRQDTGSTWGDALAYAVAAVSSLSEEVPVPA